MIHRIRLSDPTYNPIGSASDDFRSDPTSDSSTWGCPSHQWHQYLLCCNEKNINFIWYILRSKTNIIKYFWLALVQEMCSIVIACTNMYLEQHVFVFYINSFETLTVMMDRTKGEKILISNISDIMFTIEVKTKEINLFLNR